MKQCSNALHNAITTLTIGIMLIGGITEEDKKRTTQLVSLYKEGKEIHKLKEPRNLFSRSHLKDPAESKSKFLPFW